MTHNAGRSCGDVAIVPDTDGALLGLPFARVTLAECADFIVDSACAGVGGWLLTPNASILRRYSHDSHFRALAQDASLVVADGMPIVWAYRILGRALPERVAGSDLLPVVCAGSARRNLGVFLLGGNPGVAEEAERMLAEANDGFRSVGHYCPSLGFRVDSEETEVIRRLIRESEPAIVIVGLPCPVQEELIAALRADAPAAWWLGLGASISFLVGDVKRAPRWIQRTGLEWSYRLAQEPTRLWRRYVRGDIPFVVWLLTQAVACRIRRCSRIEPKPARSKLRTDR